MGAGKDMWIAEYEKVCEAVEDGKISVDEFRAELKRLGYDLLEIEDHVHEMRVERGEVEGL